MKPIVGLSCLIGSILGAFAPVGVMAENGGCMEVGRIVIREVHVDHDPVELAQPRHLSNLTTTPLLSPDLGICRGRVGSACR